MGFQKGNTIGKGRPKGTKNKRTLQVELLADKFQDPFELLMLFATGDWKALGYDSEIYIKEDATGSTTMGYTISPEMRLSATKEACQYLYSKRKDEPDQEDDPFEVNSLEEKKLFLEEAKAQIEALEAEVNANKEVIKIIE